MSRSGKLTPNIDQNSTRQLNLTVLQRMDPSIEEILITAAHVTFYEFNMESNQWSRKDVEGSLFVVRRNSQPHFQFIVMNRRSTENWVENLLKDLEYEVQVPYLLYRNASQEVYGIWFYNSHECEEVANLFGRVMDTFFKVTPDVKGPSSKSEFEDVEPAPNMTTIVEPLDPSVSAIGAPQDSSLMNFFNAALNIGSNPLNAVDLRPPHQSSATIPRFPNTATSPSAAPPPYPEAPPLSIPSSLNSVTPMKLVTNLVRPSSFMAAPSYTSSLIKQPIHSVNPASTSFHPPPLSLQRPYGTPLLQPFPPPTPPPSLTPSPSPPTDIPTINRDRVRNALVKLVQDDQFVDMFYKALLKAEHT
ncbi:hypothetical protein SAY86_030769 [Trapa natans]|uniref:mRNA-decapping enzyme-like protein n=1 Tax=Trapa natans TaxID=22666 RepID=A0AAN7MSU4_TRANT|nr:hypothetical protein SAY86_030769 [Trapa natans]